MEERGNQDDKAARARPATLLRALNLPLLTLYGLGVTIGAGIYVLVGATIGEAGSRAALAFLIAAAVAAFTALSYAELATRYPVSAGEAVYVGAGFGIGPLTLAVGLLVALSGIVSSSAIAIGAASYLASFTPFSIPLLTLATVLAMGLLSAWGISQSVTVAAIVTLIEIAGLLLVIGWGIFSDASSGVAIAELLPDRSAGHWEGIGSAALLAFFAFVGFEDMANVAEEVKDPERIFPRAIMLTLCIATLLYMATAITVILTVPEGALAASEAPLALVFADAPAGMAELFIGIAIIATVNGILIQMIMASRVLYGLAHGGRLPRQLAWVSPRTRTPLVATALVVAAIMLLTQAYEIGALAERTSQIVLIVFILVNLSLLRIRRREQGPPRDIFCVPQVVPLLGVVTSIALLATMWL